MKVKDLIKYLSQFDKNLDVVFYNDTLDENHWGCELNIDDVNGKDLIKGIDQAVPIAVDDWLLIQNKLIGIKNN